MKLTGKLAILDKQFSFFFLISFPYFYPPSFLLSSYPSLFISFLISNERLIIKKKKKMPKRSRKSVGTKEGGQAMLLLSGDHHLVERC